MKTQIRHSAFESNSSSSHSLTISNKGTFSTKDIPVLPNYKGKNKVILLTGDEYGWGYESYNDALSKANYIATYLHGCDKNSAKKEMFERVLLKETGAAEVVYETDNAYIDHQSSDVAGDAFESEKRLRHFIFNNRSELIIDNDNH